VTEEPGLPHLLPQRLETDAESVERDLFKLVLTIVELVRQLMEKQALRRVDEGDLTDEQVEGLGLGLMHLEQAMDDLKARYDLTTDDLDIDLGPLGSLLSRWGRTAPRGGGRTPPSGAPRTRSTPGSAGTGSGRRGPCPRTPPRLPLVARVPRTRESAARR
jgi:hypothetical protein